MIYPLKHLAVPALETASLIRSAFGLTLVVVEIQPSSQFLYRGAYILVLESSFLVLLTLK